MSNTALWRVIPIRSKGVGYSSYAQATYIQSTNSVMDNIYVLPFTSVSNTTLPTSYSLLSSSANIFGAIRENGYVYYCTSATNGIHRYNESTTEVKTLFAYSGDSILSSYINFSLYNDGRIIAALENYTGDYLDWNFEWWIGDFDTGETSLLFSTPVYPNVYSTENLYNWHFSICNGKLIPMIWSEVDVGTLDFRWLFDFWIVDIDTATELYHYNSGEIEYYGLFQYPVSPPIVVGNSVFFSYHQTLYRDANAAPFIFKVNTSSLSTTMIRPRIDGLLDCGGYLMGGCYDPNTGNLIWINRYIDFSDDLYAAVMSLNPTTMSYTSIVSVLETGYHYPSASIKSNTEAYILYADGNVYALGDFVNSIVDTISPILKYYPTDEPQIDHICPVVDGNGYIWFISGGVVYGRKISDNSLVSSDISFPMPSGTGARRTWIYMSRDGKLSVINRNETSTTDKLYILN